MATIRPDENCPYCGLPDEADWEMVQCDQCDGWCHFRCAGVTRAVKQQSWICGQCQGDQNRQNGQNHEQKAAATGKDNFSVPPVFSSLRSHTGSSIRQGLQLLDEQFQIRQKRLADEKALQERRLALDEEYAKQQYDLCEERLKVRKELLLSLRGMSVGGSRVSARSQASSMRTERVRQWIKQQQNPVENPQKVDPRGAVPNTRPTLDLSPLRNPNTLKVNKSQNPVENPRKVVPRGAFPNTRPTRDVSPLQNPNVTQHLMRASKTDDSYRAGRPHEFPADEARGSTGYEGVPDGLGRRNDPANREQGAERPCPAARQFADKPKKYLMPSTLAHDTRRPCPAPRSFVDGLGRRHMPSTSAQDAQQTHQCESRPPQPVPRTRQVEDSVFFGGRPREGEAGRDRPLTLQENEVRNARNCFETPAAPHDDGAFALLTGAPSGRLHPQPPQPFDAGAGRSRLKTPQAHLQHNKSEQRDGIDRGPQNRVQFGGITPEQLASRQVLPRKLAIFSGSETCGYTYNENLVRLLDYLRDEHVRGQLLLPQSVPRVIETLRRIYGRIEQLCDYLEATNLQDHLGNPMLLQELGGKIPAGTKIEWVRFERRHGQAALRTFVDLMAGIAEDACEVAPMVDKRVEKRNKERGFVHAHDWTAVSEQNTYERVENKPCRACQSNEHKIRNCDMVENLTYANKVKLDKRQICYTCLNEHGDTRCQLKIQCNVKQCRERHHPLTHCGAATTHVTEATDVAHDAQMLFRFVAVTLHHGSRFVRTTAFLDERTSMSLVEHSLTEVLAVESGESEPLPLIWTADISRKEKYSKKISVQMSTAGSGKKHQLTLRTVSELKLPTPSFKLSSLTKQFKHLRGIKVGDNLGKPRLLSGLDNLHWFAPQESRIGQFHEPTAVKSKRGWFVYGTADCATGRAVVVPGVLEPDFSISELVQFGLRQIAERQHVGDCMVAPKGLLAANLAQQLWRQHKWTENQRTVKLGDVVSIAGQEQQKTNEWMRRYGVNQIPRNFGTKLHGLGNVADAVELRQANKQIGGDGRPTTCHRGARRQTPEMKEEKRA